MAKYNKRYQGAFPDLMLAFGPDKIKTHKLGITTRMRHFKHYPSWKYIWRGAEVSYRCCLVQVPGTADSSLQFVNNSLISMRAYKNADRHYSLYGKSGLETGFACHFSACLVDNAEFVLAVKKLSTQGGSSKRSLERVLDSCSVLFGKEVRDLMTLTMPLPQ